ncbi:GDH/6PGL endoplasmic bifunctional protein-like [Gigantopelta aegis]|uniref:GDH/6PGL endoplasmic bifunctional protein-like n=1 Tax=Gigantopelta aegis TaxID=1735272 RepID=UPI001B88A2C5|nr:GDH/6PGL endoplasmic bifunctional protein-like [Gigantopelta aegis]
MGVIIACLVFALVCFDSLIPSETTSVRHTDVIVVGATGDLAQKYLWGGFFHLFLKRVGEGHSFTIYAVGRSPPEHANPILDGILKEKTKCPLDMTVDHCIEMKNKFHKATSYSMLKTNEHYFEFCSAVHDRRRTSGRMDGEIIFYLSVPSSSYIAITQLINKHCRLHSGKIKVRIVLEKPFGNNKESAKMMDSALGEVFTEEEIYRVDHYLGKTIVREILTFRFLNRRIEDKLNKDDVQRVEIFMKETVGVKGRIDFFDQTGILRDVFQNHLTELLTLVAMDLPQNLSSPEDVKAYKLNLLRSVRPATRSSVLTGQYSDYLTEVKNELSDTTNSTFTPTFAVAMLHINSPRWEGIPFVLVGGKRLDERSSFIRIIFKQNRVCVSQCADSSGGCRTEQLVFQLGHGALKTPAILVSKSLGIPVWPSVLKEADFNHIDTVFGDTVSNLFIATPVSDPDAYAVLIEDILSGRKDRFVGSKHLSALWDIWSEVITQTDTRKPKIYEAGDEARILDFIITGSMMVFTDKIEQVVERDFEDDQRQTPTTFLGYKLVTNTAAYIVSMLAEDIAKKVQSTLNHSWNFHIAFSGGDSPKRLFHVLAQQFAHLPWKRIHVWQMDERCVPFTDFQSNFYHLQDLFLSFVPIPHENVHPMPVDINGKLCATRDSGRISYGESLKYHLPDLSFDYSVLGLGSDGHTASLFPNSPALSTDMKVVLTENTSDHFSRRMTLTFPVINNSKHISVLVTGKEKSNILKQLEESEGSVSDFPILGVNPAGGSLVWYIDGEALPEL